MGDLIPVGNKFRRFVSLFPRNFLSLHRISTIPSLQSSRLRSSLQHSLLALPHACSFDRSAFVSSFVDSPPRPLSRRSRLPLVFPPPGSSLSRFFLSRLVSLFLSVGPPRPSRLAHPSVSFVLSLRLCCTPECLPRWEFVVVIVSVDSPCRCGISANPCSNVRPCIKRCPKRGRRDGKRRIDC